MVAIFSGAGTGLERGSGNVVGAAGTVGVAGNGRAGEQILLNAATGNLVISQRDEFLVGRGPDAAVSRTYNSLGDLSDDNGDNWRLGGQSHLTMVAGAVNQTGSILRRHMADGSKVDYAWNGTAYLSTEGAGAYDTLTRAAGGWHWTDGDTRTVAYFEDHGPIARLRWIDDTSANRVTYGYTGDRLTSITTNEGSVVEYGWTGNNVTEVRASYTDLKTGQRLTQTRTRYVYDAANRLASVTTDLSPLDRSVADGDVYTTAYTYHDTSRRIATVTQTDGSRMSFAYDAQGRVTGMTQAVSGTVARTTTIAYGNGTTSVTDASGQVTTLEYNGDGTLKTIVAPSTSSGPQATRFTYNVRGDVTSVTDAAGRVTRFVHDDRGNMVTSLDADGSVTQRTYSATNQLLTETRDANRIRNADMLGTAGWIIGYSPHGIAGSLYSGVHYDIPFVKAEFTATAAGQVFSIATGTDDWFPTVPGERLAIEIGVEPQGPVSHVSLALFWRDANGNTIGSADVISRNGPQPYDTRIGGFVDVPAGAVSARLETYLATSGAGTGALALTRPTVTRALAGQVAMPAFGAVAGGGRPATTRYAYDSLSRLRYMIDAEGGVTEYRYDGVGNLAWTIAYTESRYDGAALGPTGAPTEAQMDAWGNTADRRAVQATHTLYDARGNVSEQIGYAGFDANGNAIGGAGQSRTVFTYDHAGQLLSRSVVVAEDGLSPDQGLSRYVLEPGGRGGGETLAKTYTLNPAVRRTAIDADFIRLDSWDGEPLHVFINGTKAFSFTPRTFYDVGTTSLIGDSESGQWSVGGVHGTWSMVSTGAERHLGGNQYATDLVYRLHIEADGAGASIKLGFGSGLDEARDNEAVAIDNVVVTQDAQFDDFENGRAVGWVQNGAPAAVLLPQRGAAGGLNMAVGRLGGTGDAEALSKTFRLNPTQGKADIAFDIAALDTWDAETMQVYLNGSSVFSFTPGYSATAPGRTGTFAINGLYGRYTITRVGGEGDITGDLGTWDQIYTVRIEVEGVGDSVRLGFGTNLNGPTWDEALAIDNVRVGQSAVVDRFEGAFPSGWISQSQSVPVTSNDGTLGSYLGRIGGTPGGAESIAKTFALDPKLGKTIVEFDFLKIDSWDQEWFKVYLNGTEAFTYTPPHYGQPFVGASGSFAFGGMTGRYTVAVASNGVAMSQDGWSDGVFRVWMEIDNPGSALTIGFGAALDEPLDNESLGIDNLSVVQIADSIDRFESGDAAGWTVGGGQAASIGAPEWPFTNFLGRFGASGNAQAVSKTFALNPQHSRTSIDFDFLKIDTWDGESFNVHLNGAIAFSFQPLFAAGQGLNGASGTFAVGAISGRYNIVAAAPNEPAAKRIYHVHMEVDGAGGTVTLGFGSTLDQAAADEAFGVDNVRVVQMPGTMYDDFETSHIGGWAMADGSTPWLNGPTSSEEGGYSRFLGRIGGSGGAETLFKNYAIDPARRRTTVEFDFLKIDSWDGEELIVFVQGTAAFRFQPETYAGGHDAASGGIVLSDTLRGSYTITSLGNDMAAPGMDPAYGERVYRVRFDIDGAGGNLRIGFGSTLNEDVWNEAYGIDNVRVTQPTEDSFDQGQAPGWFVPTGYAEIGGTPRATEAQLPMRETFVYDGMGRLIASTDLNGGATRIVFDDAASRTIITSGNGLTRTSTYTLAGELIASSEAGAFVVSGTSTFTYDAVGYPRMQTDASGRSTFWLYDKGGRKVAEVGHNGELVEYTYDVNNRVLATILYAERATAAQIALLTDSQSRPAIGDIRPVFGNRDEWTWTVYDAAGRVTGITNRRGEVVEFEYDANGQLALTRSYANRLDINTVGTFFSAPVLKVVRPGASAADIVSRNFYDRDGRLVGMLDGAGYLTTVVYDAAGRKTDEVAHANVTASNLRANGSLAQLIASVGTVADDRQSRFVYDVQGRLRFALDALNYVTEYRYDNGGNAGGGVVQAIRYGGTIPGIRYTVETASQAVAAAALGSNVNTRSDFKVYDRAGRVAYTIDPAGAVVGYRYDTEGRVVRETRFAATLAMAAAPSRASMDLWAQATPSPDDRTTRTFYDARGQVRFSVDAEGYVTGYEYDASGRTTRTVQWDAKIALTDGATTATIGGLVGSGASETRFLYDPMGRLTMTIDPLGVRSKLLYNNLGRVEFAIDAADTADESRTRYQYDSAGRKIAETRAFGWGEQATTSYSYDAFGNLRSFTDPNGNVTTRTYDRLGRMTTETNALNGVMHYAYTAFGELAIETDQRGNATYRHYDRRGLLVAVRDAENYVTETSYTAFGQVMSVTRRERPTTVAPGAWPGVAADTGDATTAFEYDRAGRVVRTVDAEGFTERQWYDAFGNLRQVLNKVGGVTLNRYDRRGQLISQVAPNGSSNSAGDVIVRGTDATRFDPTYYGTVNPDLTGLSAADLEYHWLNHGRYEGRNPNAFFNTSFYTSTYPDVVASGQNPLTHFALWGMNEGRLPASTFSTGNVSETGGVMTQFDYDARGNRTRMIEAAGLAEARVTTYVYDRTDRLVETHLPEVTVLLADFIGSSTVTPVEYYTYDRRGNVIQTVAANGARTLSYYDALNRKVAEIGATGTFRQFQYDASGNLTHSRTWATPVALPGWAGGAPPAAPAGTVRETTYTYDALHRMVGDRVSNVIGGWWDGVRHQRFQGAVGNNYVYDATGNLIEETNGRGHTVRHGYDRLGRRVRTVDAEGFTTSWVHDADGNVVRERRWATKGAQVEAAGWQTEVPAPPHDDRITSFTYDRMGRRLSETRLNVLTFSLDANGNFLAPDGQYVSAAVTYSYNALGQVVRKTESTGDYTDFAYDRSGRMVAETRSAFVDSGGNTLAPVLRYGYDALGNLVRTTQGANVGGDERVTRHLYDTAGRMTLSFDASGGATDYTYDIGGNVVRQAYTRFDADLTTSYFEAILTVRDILGRPVEQSIGRWVDNNHWVKGDAQRTEYNAFGEVSRRGINGFQEEYAYDNAGQVWRSNAGDGVWRYYLHDGAGNTILTIEGEGADIAGLTLDQALALVAAPAGSSEPYPFVDGVNVTINFFTATGQQYGSFQPQRERSATERQDLWTSREINAFGEVTRETDLAGGWTFFKYNTMGRLIAKTLPTISVTNEQGVTSNVTPVERYFNDISGRLIGVEDANGSRTRRSYMAGTGYGGTAGLVASEWHADGGTVSNGYNRFGDLTRVTDEIGRATTMAYDAMGRLIQTIRPSGAWDGWSYDILGQRTRHWTSYAPSDVERTGYDMQGRIVSHVAVGGDTTTTSYSWQGSLATTGMGTFGGWIATKTVANQRTSVEETDMFGRRTRTVDLGGRTTWLSYDRAGRMTGSTGAQTLTYSYYNTGRMNTVSTTVGTVGSGNWSRITTTNRYDAAGNLLGQKTVDEGAAHQAGGRVTQDATATYDVMGRMTGWAESGVGTAPAASIAYSYDAVGNIRRSYAQFRSLDATGAASSYINLQDYWYRYDAMNRVVTAKGQLLDGTVQRGYDGTDLQYDAAGQRVRSISSINATAMVQNPNYGGPYQYQRVTENQIGSENQIGVGGDPRLIEVPYRQEQFEQYDYSLDGNLYQVHVAKGSYEDQGDGKAIPTAAVGPGVLRASYDHDALGRVTGQTDYLGGTAGYGRQVTYNASGQITTEVVTQAQRQSSDGGYDTVRTTNTTSYGSGAGYALGAAVSVTTESTRNGTTQPVVTTTNGYDWYGGAVLTGTSVTRSGATTSSSYDYDVAGQLKSAQIDDGRQRTVTFTNDLFGQVLRRDETGPAAGSPHEVWYRFGGRQMGYVGNNGTLDTNYEQSIAARTAAPGTGAFRGGASNYTPYADFDQSVAPITSYAQGGGGGSYTVQAGDTLSGIAQTLWGDGALWYRLAQANGLSGASALATGQVLSVPAGVSKSTHNAGTFEPYDAARIIGDTSPGVAAAPQAKRNKCGAFGAILMIAVAVAVTIASSGALLALSGSAANIGAGIGAVLGAGGATAGAVATAGVVGGMIGGAASQGVGIALGIQDKFSWKGVALAGLSAAVGGSLGGLGGSGIAGAAIRGVAGSVLTQGIAIATGLQSKFDFVGVAVAGVVGAVGQGIGGDSQKFGRQFGASAASAIAGAATRSILTGTSFGDNVKAVLPDVIETTIGRLAARSIAGSGRSGGNRPAGSNPISASPETVSDADMLVPMGEKASALDAVADGADASPVADVMGRDAQNPSRKGTVTVDDMPVFEGGPVDGKRTRNVEYVNEAVPYTPEVDGRPLLERDGREMFGYYQGNPGKNLSWVDVGSPEQWEQMRLSQAVNIIIDGGQLAALDIANGLLDIPKGAISGLVGVANAMLDLRSSDPTAAIRTAQRAASVRNVISNPSSIVRAALEPLRQMFEEGSVRGVSSYVGGAAISAGGVAVVNSVASRGIKGVAVEGRAVEFAAGRQAFTADISNVTGKAATARNRAINAVISEDLGGLRFTHIPEYSPFIGHGVAMEGTGTQIGKQVFNSRSALRNTIVHEELHHRWWSRGVYGHHPAGSAMETKFYKTIERYERMRGW